MIETCGVEGCENVASQRRGTCLTHKPRPSRSPQDETRLEQHVRDLVSTCPPLTPEQRDRLVLLLRPEVAK